MVRAPTRTSPPSPVVRYVVGGLCLLLGPLAFAAYAVYVGSSLAHEQVQASAEVVGLKPYRGSGHSRSYCPVFRLQVAGKPVEVESGYCTNDESEFAVGQTLRVRYPSGDLDAISPDDFWKAHDEAIPLAVVSALFTAAAVFMLKPDKRSARG